MFLKPHKYWSMAENHLSYPVVAQNQGDHVAGPFVQGQDFCEIQAGADHLDLGSDSTTNTLGTTIMVVYL